MKQLVERIYDNEKGLVCLSSNVAKIERLLNEIVNAESEGTLMKAVHAADIFIDCINLSGSEKH